MDVTNKGKRKGTLTVQAYIHDVAAEITRPVRELKAFKKVELAPGETKTVTLTLAPEAFEYYHFDNTLCADPGEFLIWVAEDSKSGEPIKIKLV